MHMVLHSHFGIEIIKSDTNELESVLVKEKNLVDIQLG